MDLDKWAKQIVISGSRRRGREWVDTVNRVLAAVRRVEEAEKEACRVLVECDQMQNKLWEEENARARKQRGKK